MADLDSYFNQPAPQTNTQSSSAPDLDSYFNSNKQSQTSSNPTQPDTSITNTLASKAKAAALGFERGVGTFSSTLQKLVTPYSSKALRAVGVPEQYINTPEKAQASFNDLNKSYETDPDSIAHPLLSGAGNLVGQAAMTAPLAAATGGVGALGEGAAADLGLGATSQAVAGITGRGLANSALGGIMGGTSNTEGQDPNQVWNPQNAKLGALTGAVISPITDLGISSINALNKTEALQNSLSSIGAKTKAMASDISGGVNQWFANNVLQKIPVIGTGAFRDAQNSSLQQDLQNYIGSVSQDTINASKTKIANTIQDHSDHMHELEKSSWNDFRDALDKTPQLSAVNRDVSQPNIDDLKENSMDVLSSKYKQQLNNLPDQLSPQDHLDFKRDTWQQYSTLQNKVNAGTATADEGDAATTLRNTYFNLNKDLENSVQGTDAEPAYRAANAVSTGVKTLFDPRYNKQLVGAVNDMNNSQRGVDKYINYLLSPNTNQKDIQNNIGFLGAEGTNEVSSLGLKNMMVKSMDQSIQGDPSLNLSKFMNNYNQLDNSSQKFIHQDAIKELQGLQTVAGQYLKSQQSSGGFLGSDVAKTAIGGAAATGAVMAPHLTGAVMLGTGGMSLLSRFAPIKQALIGVNNITQAVGADPGLSQYILQKANNTLVRNGVTMAVDHLGNVNIDKPDENTK